MIITYETTLKDFEFWGQARENISKPTDEELNALEEYFSEVHPVVNRTALNDMFAYYFTEILGVLGLDEEKVLER